MKAWGRAFSLFGLSGMVFHFFMVMWLTGCKPNPVISTDLVSPTNRSALVLQDEVNRIQDLALENDPSKRPVVLSQPASNRRLWALQTLQSNYRATGRTNVLWDDPVQSLFEAFVDYSRVSTTNWPTLQKALAAVPEDCDDPMVQYMRVRYRTSENPSTPAAFSFMRAHYALVQSQYHPVFKFMAGWRAVACGMAADHTAELGPRVTWTTCSLEDLARDTNAPIEEVFESATGWIEHGHSQNWLDFVTSDLLKLMEQNWGQTEPYFRLRGRTEIKFAWADRGSDYAHKVSEKGWEGFAAHLAQAEKYLTRAWEMNPAIAETAYLMMRLELGQGRGRAWMEQWFNRAMALDTNNFEAASLMSFYLEPRWYGSETKALAFARSCVASDRWGGEVPLVLANLHHSLANYANLSNSPAYWHRPHVWRDIQSSYQKLFRLNPDAVGWRHDFALDAYDCGQYAVFLKQTKLFSQGTNYAFFGGRQNFQEMLARAAAAASNSKE